MSCVVVVLNCLVLYLLSLLPDRAYATTQHVSDGAGDATSMTSLPPDRAVRDYDRRENDEPDGVEPVSRISRGLAPNTRIDSDSWPRCPDRPCISKLDAVMPIAHFLSGMSHFFFHLVLSLVKRLEVFAASHSTHARG